MKLSEQGRDGTEDSKSEEELRSDHLGLCSHHLFFILTMTTLNGNVSLSKLHPSKSSAN